MPQLVNEHDTFVLKPNTCAENKNLNEHDDFVLEPNTCAKNKNLLPIAVEKDKLKLLYSLDTWVILSLILCVLLLLWKRNLCLLICLGYLDVHFTLLLANIIIKESIWYTEFIFVQI
jgi:hypothetical protein